MCKCGTTPNKNVYSVTCVLTDGKCGSHNSRTKQQQLSDNVSFVRDEAAKCCNEM